MIRPNIVSLAIFSMFLATSSQAWASGNDFNITDGQGEQVVIKHHWFGRTDVGVKDRLSDQVVEHKGLFGSKEQDVSVLGNSFSRKKGIFGSSDIQAKTIFGDKITTHKGIFGKRTTNVDVSGVSNTIKSLLDSEKNKPSGLSQAVPPLNRDAISPSTNPLDKDVLSDPESK